MEYRTVKVSKENVVVSGLSGRFPKSHNVDEFWSNLVKGIDMVSVPGSRFPKYMKNLPRRVGHLDELDKFDYEFFNIPKKDADEMDPQLRIAIEVTYEAIIDSGHTMDEIRGKRTGFFHSVFFYDALGIIGELPFDPPNYMNSYAGLIPFIFDFQGPVSSADSACSSSQYALTEAYLAISHGLCDRAVVIGLNFCQNLAITQQFMELKMISENGTCRSLDKARSGFARSEGIVAIVLEKQSDALRCYTKMLTSKTDVDGFREEGITYPSSKGQIRLIEETFNEIGLDPSSVDYIEGHLTGTPAGDFVEGQTIYKCFAEKRSEPLLVGCLKSNLGHTEASAGLAATIKVSLIFQKGIIPGNLHYHEPNPNIKGLLDGKFKPVTENTGYNGRYISMETFGFGGANAHSIFERFDCKSSSDDYILSRKLPRLVCLQARNENSLAYLQSYLEVKQNEITKPFLYLMDRYSRKQNFQMESRGYSLLSSGQSSITFDHFVGNYDHSKQPVIVVTLPSVSEHVIYFDQVFQEFSNWPHIISSFNKVAVKSGFNFNGNSLVSETIDKVPDRRMIAFATRIILLKFLANIGINFQVKEKNFLDKLLIRYFSEKITLEEIFQLLLTFESKNDDITFKSNSNTNGKQSISDKEFNVLLKIDTWDLTETEFSKVIHLGNKQSQGFKISGLEFLKCLGELYSIGIDIDVENLYPTVKLPVPSDTLSLHSIMKWDRSKKVTLYSFPDYFNYVQSHSRKYSVEVKEDNSSFYLDHKIDGSPLFPATGYLMLAWNAIAEFNYASLLKFPVTFKDVKFERATFLTDKEIIFRVYYLPGTGRFIIKGGDSVVAVGSIFPLSESEAQKEFETNDDVPFTSELLLETKDVYKELRIRGYDYGKTFKCIKEANEFGQFGRINWSNPLVQNNVYGSSEEDDFFRTWITFSDSLLQLAILSNRVTRDLFIPIGLTSLSCDPKIMLQTIQTQGSDPSLLAVHNLYENTIQTTGLKIKGLLGAKKNRKNQPVQLGKFIFIPYNDHVDMLDEKSLKLDEKDSELFSCERFVRPFIHTLFSESPRRKKLTIWERNDGKLILADNLIKAFDSLMVDATDYTVLQSTDCEFNLPSGIARDIKNPENGQYRLCSNKKFDLLVYKIFSKSEFNSEIGKFIGQSSNSSMILTLFMERSKNLPIDESDETCISIDIVTETMASYDWIVLQQHTINLGSKGLKGLLFRKAYNVQSKNHKIIINSFDYSWIEELKDIIEKSSGEDRIWLISNEKEFNGIAGFRRCLTQEQFGDQIHCIANRPTSSDRALDLSEISFTSPTFDMISKKNLKMNFYDSDFGWGNYNFFSLEQTEQEFALSEKAYIQVMTPGDLTSLTWTETEIDTEDPRKVAIDIHFAALNFRDVMVATGRLTQVADISSKAAPMSMDIGVDYSGVDMKTGERIMGAIPGRGIATRACVLRNNFMWKVPDDWTMEEAATVPTVYSTVVYALFLRGNIMKGESILIHAGAGGIGIAAINICLSMGYKVFTTVGTQEKRDFIRKMFPKLSDSVIFNSRDTTFEQGILNATNGNGVDIILNSLSEEKLQASLRCLAPGGRFLEIGKYDMVQNSQINIGQLDEGRSFHGICLDTMVPTDSDTLDLNSIKLTSQLISQLILKLINEKIIKPLPTICFEKDEIEEAFRFMANGKHIGKVLIKIRDNDQQFTRVNAKRIVKFSSEKIYIIVGGFGGIGLELALWITERGARHIILNSRSDPKTQYHRYCLRILEERGVNVTISNHDLTNYGNVLKLIKDCNLPVGGFFNSALVLRDALFTDQTVTNFEAVCSPKINITISFDQVTRKLCPELDYFVVFSSVACGFGNLGQSNYGLANSFMESICEKRRLDGLHGLAIEWGAVGDVGFVAETYESDVNLRGTVPQRLPSVLATLEKFLLTSESIVSSLTPFEIYRDKGSESGNLLKDVIHIFQIKDISSIEPKTSLADLGMDSLMGIEIQQAIERRYNLTLDAKAIRTLTWEDVVNFESRTTSIKDSNGSKNSTVTESSGTNKPVNLLIKLYQDPIFVLKESSVDSSMATLMIPSVENNWKDLETLAQKLSGRVLGINYVKDLNDLDSIEEVAEYVVKLILQNFDSDFNLICYSYGAVIGSHVCQILSSLSNGPKVSKIVTFDGDFDCMKASKAYQDRSQINLIIDYMRLLLPNLTSDDITVISKPDSFDDKLEILRTMLNTYGYNEAQLEQASGWLRMVYQNIMRLRNLKPIPLIVHPMIHIKSTLPSFFYESTVSQEKKVNEFYFQGNHHSYIGTNFEKISEIVTQFLK